MKDKDQFIELLKNRLLLPLPGEDAQFAMAPVSKERVREIKSMNFNPKKSAVLILLFSLENSFSLILIKRSEYEGVHSGQMAFPGGRQEEHDVSLKHTALRETFEEIGVESDQVQIIGQLSDVYIVPSNYLVTPFIGVLNDLPNFQIDPKEVQRVVCVEWKELNNPSSKGIKKLNKVMEVK